MKLLQYLHIPVNVLIFILGSPLIILLYFLVLTADYTVSLKLTEILYGNNLENGFAVSTVSKMSSPFMLGNLSFGFVQLISYGWGILETSKYSKNIRLLNDNQESIQRSRAETGVKMLFLAFLNSFPIALVTTKFSLHSSLFYISVILYLSFFGTCVFSYRFGKYVNVFVQKYLCPTSGQQHKKSCETQNTEKNKQSL